jgi:hypothetical protein
MEARAYRQGNDVAVPDSQRSNNGEPYTALNVEHIDNVPLYSTDYPSLCLFPFAHPVGGRFEKAPLRRISKSKQTAGCLATTHHFGLRFSHREISPGRYRYRALYAHTDKGGYRTVISALLNQYENSMMRAIHIAAIHTNADQLLRTILTEKPHPMSTFASLEIACRLWSLD